MRKKAITLSAICLVAATFAACGGDDEGSEVPLSSPSDAEETSPDPGSTESSASEETTSIEVWLAGPEGLLVSVRTIPATEAIGRATLEQLLGGPSDLEAAAGLSTAIPDGTDLLDLSISDRVATVDLSREFESGGGSASVQARVAQVVFTITQFPTVDEVNFRLEGEPVETLSGEGLILDGPQSRKNWSEQLAPIVVVEPGFGTESGSPLVVSGTANVFEATVSIELLGTDGELLAETFTTATCGTGCRGDYRAEIPFEVEEATEATLRVFESSAEDGSPLHVVEIPVLLLP